MRTWQAGEETNNELVKKQKKKIKLKNGLWIQFRLLDTVVVPFLTDRSLGLFLSFSVFSLSASLLRLWLSTALLKKRELKPFMLLLQIKTLKWLWILVVLWKQFWVICLQSSWWKRVCERAERFTLKKQTDCGLGRCSEVHEKCATFFFFAFFSWTTEWCNFGSDYQGAEV